MSTEDAIAERQYAAALLFDIFGAFDNVWWPLVLRNLRDRKCPRNVFEIIVSYFSDRRVVFELGNSNVFKQATRGCP